MIKLLSNIKTSKSGASAAEYALIVAVMGGLVVAGVTTLGGGFKESMQTEGDALKTTEAPVIPNG